MIHFASLTHPISVQVRAGFGELHCGPHEGEPGKEAEGNDQATPNDEQWQAELRLLEVFLAILYGQKLAVQVRRSSKSEWNRLFRWLTDSPIGAYLNSNI